jgi:hypothetical protein
VPWHHIRSAFVLLYQQLRQYLYFCEHLRAISIPWRHIRQQFWSWLGGLCSPIFSRHTGRGGSAHGCRNVFSAASVFVLSCLMPYALCLMPRFHLCAHGCRNVFSAASVFVLLCLMPYALCRASTSARMAAGTCFQQRQYLYFCTSKASKLPLFAHRFQELCVMKHYASLSAESLHEILCYCTQI